MKTTIKLFTLLATIFTMTACTHDIDLAGYAWTGSGSYTEDGERIDNEFALVCTSTSEGTLFLSENYGNEPMGFCLAMPFTYTWDDNKGTVTAKLELPDGWKGKAKGTYAFRLPINYTKNEGLVMDLSNLRMMLELPYPSINLTQKEYAKPADMTGTRWTMEFDGDIYGSEERLTSHYRYELEFVNSSAAVLNLSMTEEGDEAENMRWNVNYTYSKGVGRTSIYFDGETVKGGFYMPDDTHMTFSDGENLLNLVKQ